MDASDTITRFESEVRRAAEAANITGSRLIVAVSGGPDSLAMLHALHRIRYELLLDLHVAHLDHRLRGVHSTADAEFVATTCAGLAIECTVDSVDVLAFQEKRRMSLEEAAREARYDFLTRTANREGANAIALGHTADDQAETIVMNIIRGSGLGGLRGMLPKSTRRLSGSDITLFRPLLNLSKDDTLRYCEALGISPRIDESNNSREMTRNRIRLELLPMLREFNPEIVASLQRLSQNAEDALDVVNLAVDSAWAQAVKEEKDCIRIDREEFRKLDEQLRSHLMLRALSKAKRDALGIERVHVQDAMKAVSDSSGSMLHLPGGLRLAVEQVSAYLYLEDAYASMQHAIPLRGISPIGIPSETVVGEWRFTTDRISTASGSPMPSDTDVFVERFGGNVDVASLGVRCREPGDRFQPLGMSGTKKLKDFMIDEKVPSSHRDGVPLVVTSQGIAWVVGWRIAEWAKVEGLDRECLQITVERAV